MEQTRKPRAQLWWDNGGSRGTSSRRGSRSTGWWRFSWSCWATMDELVSGSLEWGLTASLARQHRHYHDRRTATTHKLLLYYGTLLLL